MCIDYTLPDGQPCEAGYVVVELVGGSRVVRIAQLTGGEGEGEGEGKVRERGEEKVREKARGKGEERVRIADRRYQGLLVLLIRPSFLTGSLESKDESGISGAVSFNRYFVVSVDAHAADTVAEEEVVDSAFDLYWAKNREIRVIQKRGT